MSRRCRTLFAAFLAGVCVAAGGPAAVQQAAAQQSAMPQDPLQLATEVGRFLFAYDQAAARATTMLLSDGADTGAVETSIARQREGGRWTVGFGRLTESGGFGLMHEVVMNEGRLVDEVRQNVDRQLPRTNDYARAARAQRQARAQLDGEHGPYNLLVVPGGAQAGHMTVYALPAQTKEEAYRLGGDYRFEVDPSAGEVVSQTPLHEHYYEAGPLPEAVSASAHEAVRPVETDVLFATVRRPPAPHFVRTQQQVYRIAPDGTITAVPVAVFEERSDVQMLSGQ